MFSKPRHQLIATLLASFDNTLLFEHQCYFGGGTAIALKYGEYRTSFDVDFLISAPDSYKQMRELVKKDGLSAILQPAFRDTISASPARVDQYGIRGHFTLAGTPLKFEIVREARIDLEFPQPQDRIGEISCLTTGDLVAEKLLANSDRYLDKGVFSRDLIDLAFMDIHDIRSHPGFFKATAAYGSDIERDLNAAIAFFAGNLRWVERCSETLEISAPIATILQKVTALSQNTKH